MSGSGLADWYENALDEQTTVLIDKGEIQRFGDDGAEYFCRPNEVLVSAAFAGDGELQKQLKLLQAQPVELEVDLRVARYRITAVDVPTAVSRLRKAANSAAAASPHHVLFGAPRYRGSPGGPPVLPGRRRQADTLPAADEGSGITIGVVDTGISKDALDQLPWMQQHVHIRGDIDIDVLDADGDGRLDLEAGHGTFIAGLIQQVAGGADVAMRAALTPMGITDEITVATAMKDLLDRQKVRLFNLSFGGYTDDAAGTLLGLDAVLGRDDCVFVAAAGNHNSSRPFYPAADTRVIAVAALGPKGRAGFSNYGDWVDASIRGQHLLSAYVAGTDEFDTDRDGAPDEFTPGPSPCALWSGTSFAAPQVAALIAAEAARSGASLRNAADTVLASGTRSPRLGVRLTSSVRAGRAPAGVP